MHELLGCSKFMLGVFKFMHELLGCSKFMLGVLSLCMNCLHGCIKFMLLQSYITIAT